MNDNVDVKFLRMNSPGFENAEEDLLELGWKEKRFTRAIDKDIKRAYFVYLVREKADKLKRGLTSDEIAKLEKVALELKNTKMYVKSRGAAAAAAAMNNSEEYAEEEVFIPENERLEMAKRILKAERPKPVVKMSPVNSAARLKEVWANIRRPPKPSFPNASLNLPNNSRNYEGNAIPLNNVLRNFNRLNIRNRNQNQIRNTLKRKRNNTNLNTNINNEHKSRKRARRIYFSRKHRRGSKFSNLPTATRKKYMRRFSRQ